MTSIVRMIAMMALVACGAWLAGCGGGGGGGGGVVVPAAPTGINVAATTDTSVTIAWTDASTVETGYEVQSRQVGGQFATVGSLPANSTQFTHNGLTTNQVYEYRVRALGANGVSDWSATIQGTPGGGGGGGTGSVTGYVKSLLGNVPVQGAQVSVGQYLTSTTMNGSYVLSNIPAGNYLLTVTHASFNTVNRNITVSQGANPQTDVLLVSPGDGPPPPPIL